MTIRQRLIILEAYATIAVALFSVYVLPFIAMAAVVWMAFFR